MKTIIANYKMHCTMRESGALARGTLRALPADASNLHVVVCPSFPSLRDVRKIVAKTPIDLGAQNVSSMPNGAMTGEVSAAQLKDAGCAFVLVGHSERRTQLGETDAMIKCKMEQVLHVGMTPVLCVGETKEQHDRGDGAKTVIAQIVAALDGVVVPRSERIVVAYEPAWAIGREAAAVSDVVAMHREIRRAVRNVCGAERDVAVLYGGAVDEKNVQEFLREQEIDGVLVGGASVVLHEFVLLLNAAMATTQTQSV